jgi:hypothetical protein
MLRAKAGAVLFVCWAAMGFVGVTTGGASAFRFVTVALGHGHVGRYQWWVGAEREEGDHASLQRPCLILISQYPWLSQGHRGYEGSETSDCGDLSRPGTVISTSESIDFGKQGRTMLAMAVPATTSRVWINFGGHGKDLPLRLVSDTQAGDAGLRPFRYWAHGFVGHVCPRRFLIFGEKGQKVFDSGVMDCRRG